MGLLLLASMLREHGLNVSYIDCLDRFHPKSRKTKAHKTNNCLNNVDNNKVVRNGRGPYLKTKITKPSGFNDVNRTYSRYGIGLEWFIEDLLTLDKPDVILVTSLMTYWASGVQETINKIKTVFSDVPIILGGIYATLCFEHAKKYSGADLVIKGPGEKKIFQIVEKYTNFRFPDKWIHNNINSRPLPAYDLQHCIQYIPILTSTGCPFSCVYCASNYLNDNKFLQRSYKLVIKEIIYWYNYCGVKDFVFYDDALLINSQNHANLIFQGIIDSKIKVNFHTPNALHIREITDKTASLMFKAGFKTIRLGLETTVFKNRDTLDNKISKGEFNKTVITLKNAGFKSEQIGAYLLVGLPFQDFKDIEYSIKTVLRNGVIPIPAYYTPIAHTPMWKEAVKASRYKIEEDPIYTNNAVLPCNKNFSWDIILKIRKLTKR